MTEDIPQVLLPIDEYSASTVPIELFFNDTKLASGTAFIWQATDRHYLITNWHNVTGRNPFTGEHLACHAGEPDSVRVYFCMPPPNTNRHGVSFRLRDADGTPNWMVHHQHGRRVDVVAIPINVPDVASANPINKMEETLLDVQIGMDVFVLGYPLGIGVTALPVWKRASIASEPSLIVSQQLFIYLDTASRPGMSGSPVIRRSWGSPHLLQHGFLLSSRPRASRFVGVYSGRVGPSDLQLGLMWPVRFVEEIISNGVRDSNVL